MNEQNDKYLCEKYPKIFSGRNGDPKETLMCFGFCHDDGWLNIIDNLCKEIQDYCDLKNKQEYVEFQVIAIQVKQKWGGLRFYVSSGDDYIYKLITKAEQDSYKICEICGNPGELKETGCWITLCESCVLK